MKKLVVFSCERYIIFICSRGTRKKAKARPPHERERNAPKSSEIKGTPRPLTLELANMILSF